MRDSLLQDWIRARSIEPHVDLLPSVRFNVCWHSDGSTLCTRLTASDRSQFNEENLGQAELAVQYRLVYLCHAFPTDESISFLTKMAYEPSQKVSTTTRIRALCVLLQVASPADINKMQSYDGIRDYLQILFYLVDCEELRISVRTRELYSLEKVALARSLWVKRSNEPKVQRQR